MGSVYLTFSILFNVVANTFLKTGAEITVLSSRKVILLGVGLFIGLANTLCYIKALETMKLGTAYAVFAAASTLLIALLSVLLFHETISVQKSIALLTICLGLLLLWGT